MTEHPTIATARLSLRPWAPADVAALCQLAGRREIADTMISVPHPFTEEYASAWIASHADAWEKGLALHWAITLAASGTAVGAAELRAIDREHHHGELSFWIGVPWWGQGLVTEAGQAVLRFGFGQLQLNRIYAFHMVRNPASGRVLAKLGLREEGLLRQCVQKWGRFEDVVVRAILRDDWEALPGKQGL